MRPEAERWSLRRLKFGVRDQTREMEVICMCNPWAVVPYLASDASNLRVLVVDFRVHVHGHVPQVGEHSRHLLHVLLHLVFASIVGDSVHKCSMDFRTGKAKSLSIFTKNEVIVLKKRQIHPQADQSFRGSRSFIPLHVIFDIQFFEIILKTWLKNAQHGFIGRTKHSDVSLG